MAALSERKLRLEDEAYLGPVAVAQFVELAWLDGWPLVWTTLGLAALRRGKYGLWDGQHQALPIGTAPSPSGAAGWRGRNDGAISLVASRRNLQD